MQITVVIVPWQTRLPVLHTPVSPAVPTYHNYPPVHLQTSGGTATDAPPSPLTGQTIQSSCSVYESYLDTWRVWWICSAVRRISVPSTGRTTGEEGTRRFASVRQGLSSVALGAGFPRLARRQLPSQHALQPHARLFTCTRRGNVLQRDDVDWLWASEGIHTYACGRRDVSRAVVPVRSCAGRVVLSRPPIRRTPFSPSCIVHHACWSSRCPAAVSSYCRSGRDCGLLPGQGYIRARSRRRVVLLTPIFVASPTSPGRLPPPGGQQRVYGRTSFNLSSRSPTRS